MLPSSLPCWVAHTLPGIIPDHQSQCPLAQPDGVDLATCVGTGPPRAVTPRATFLGVLSKLHRFPGMRLSAACRALGHKDSDSPAPARLPPSPRLLQLPQCSLIPHQHCGVVRQPELGPGAVPQALQMEHGAGCVGRHVPSRRPRLRFRGGYVCSRTLRPGQHRRLPALAGMGTRVWGGRAPKSLPCSG